MSAGRSAPKTPPALAVVREIMLSGPKPPPGEQFCVICATTYKASVLEEAKDAIEAAQTEPGEGPLWLSMLALAPGVTLPELAIGMGSAQQFGGAFMPLCWSHLGAIKFTNLAVAQAQGGLVPGRR